MTNKKQHPADLASDAHIRDLLSGRAQKFLIHLRLGPSEVISGECGTFAQAQQLAHEANTHSKFGRRAGIYAVDPDTGTSVFIDQKFRGNNHDQKT